MRFVEYLNNKNKLVDKAKVKVVADYDGPLATKPQKEEDPTRFSPDSAIIKKELKQKKLTQNMTPYKSKESDEGQKTADNDKNKGFGDLESPGMKGISKRIEKYGYKNEALNVIGEILNESKKHKKEPEHDIYLTDPVSSRRITPHAHEISKYMSSLLKSNPRAANRLLHEVKKQGALSHLMAEVIQHPDCHREMVNLFNHKEDGEKHSKRFVRALKDSFMNHMSSPMNESVDAPRHKMMDFDSDSDSDSDQKQPSDDMGQGDNSGMDNQGGDMPQHDDSDDHSGGNGDMSNPQDSSFDKFAQDKMGMDTKDGDDPDGDGENTPDDSLDLPHGMDNFSSSNMRTASEGRKMAHHHIISEMSKQPEFLDYMKQTCESCGKKHI